MPAAKKPTSSRDDIDEFKIWNEGRVISIIEAIYIIFNIGQMQMFPPTIKVPTVIPPESLKTIKSKKEILKLSRKSKNISRFNAMDFYFRRPVELENLHFFDFMT